MRMYVETHTRFGELFEVDPEEAIDNLDRTFEMKLEAFHTLYDVSKGLFPYFRHGDTGRRDYSSGKNLFSGRGRPRCSRSVVPS